VKIHFKKKISTNVVRADVGNQGFVLVEALTVLERNLMKLVQCGSRSWIRKESCPFFIQEKWATNKNGAMFAWITG